MSAPSVGSPSVPPRRTTPLRIAVLLESSRAFGRGVLQGLGECLQSRRNWMVYFQEGGLGELLPGWFEAWQGDGIIARIEDRRMAAAIASAATDSATWVGSTRTSSVSGTTRRDDDDT